MEEACKEAADGFKFDLGDDVEIIASEEEGTVIGRAEYETGERSYLVHYRAADGRAVDQWWSERRLEAA